MDKTGPDNIADPNPLNALATNSIQKPFAEVAYQLNMRGNGRKDTPAIKVPVTNRGFLPIRSLTEPKKEAVVRDTK
jgi:hypothetical protein